ncbi:hypothetical protein ACGFII_04950 [Micromonospora chalcea]
MRQDEIWNAETAERYDTPGEADAATIPVVIGDMATATSPGELCVLPPGQPAAVFAAEPGCVGVDTYDVLRQHLVSHHFEFGDGREARVFRSPHRYVWPSELDLMGELAGFTLEHRYADWSGADFTADSRSHVSVYRLPA